MAFELHQDKHQLPITVASDCLPRVPVALGGTTALIGIPCASNNVRPFGVTNAATYLRGEVAAVYHDGNVVKMVANASVGASAEVGVASSNGSVGPGLITASAHWAVGQTLNAGAAGEIVSVFVNPRRV
jgi:hypothetical protein